MPQCKQMWVVTLSAAETGGAWDPPGGKLMFLVPYHQPYFIYLLDYLGIYSTYT